MPKMDRAPECTIRHSGALLVSLEPRPRVPSFHAVRFAVRHFVEKRYTVVVLYMSPGRKIVDGKFGLFGESG